MYTINRLPTLKLQNKSPFQLIFQCSLDYNFLRVFGCCCYSWLWPYTKSKLEPISSKCVFLGYSILHKGYKCLSLSSHKIFYSCHVLFDEQAFPFKESDGRPSVLSSPLLPTISLSKTFEQDPISPPSQDSPAVLLPLLPPSTTSLPSIVESSPEPIHHSPTVALPLFPPPSTTQSSQTQGQNVHPMVTRSKTGSLKPRTFTTVTNLPSAPTCYTETAKDSTWRKAMSEEIDVLMANGTWDLISRAQATNTIGCKWIYRIITKSDGTIDRCKAKLVAKGFNQCALLSNR